MLKLWSIVLKLRFVASKNLLFSIDFCLSFQAANDFQCSNVYCIHANRPHIKTADMMSPTSHFANLDNKVQRNELTVYLPLNWYELTFNRYTFFQKDKYIYVKYNRLRLLKCYFEFNYSVQNHEKRCYNQVINADTDRVLHFVFCFSACL